MTKITKKMLSIIAFLGTVLILTSCLNANTAITKVKLEFDQYDLYVGETLQVKVFTTVNGKEETVEVGYQSYDETIATFDNGELVGVNHGIVRVKVYAKNDASVYDTAIVHVALDLNYDVTFNIPSMLFQTEALQIVPVLPEDSDAVLTYASMNPEVISVDAQGQLVALNGGKTTIQIRVTSAEDQYVYHDYAFEIVVPYTITYTLNGEICETMNPTTYIPGTDEIVLLAPNMPGYVFEGWFDGDTKVEKITSEWNANVVLDGKVREYTIQEVKETANENVVFSGVITAVSPVNSSYNNFSILVNDGSGSIMVYRISSKTYDYDAFVVGKTIRVTGKNAPYNGLNEIASGAQIEFLGEADVPAFVTLDYVPTNDELLQLQCSVVQLTLTYVSGTVGTGTNVVFKDTNGTTLTIRGDANWGNVDKVDLKVGRKYIITGFVSWYNGPQIANLPNYPFVEAVVNDETIAMDYLDQIALENTVTEDFVLPTVEGVNWSLKETNAAQLVDGTVMITRSDADVMITLVATYSLNGVDYSKELNVTIKAMGTVGPVATFDFGTTEVTGYVANKKLSIQNLITASSVQIVAHYAQITKSSNAPHTAMGCFAVICPVRKSNNTKAGYLEFTFTDTVKSIEFEASWWSAADAKNASKIAKFEVQYSTDGATWTSVSLGSASSLDASTYTTFTVACPDAKYVRIYTEGDKTYSSNQSARIAIDNVKFF
ncbi:MAG: InlB B-repeat-containing protein [Prevotella sp.]|nr:InlB B-repeat-containing protein [Staphylococcus sp.]MCM1349680.1 InlB B-repeat-containing protein [Prevotella sp.]